MSHTTQKKNTKDASWEFFGRLLTAPENTVTKTVQARREFIICPDQDGSWLWERGYEAIPAVVFRDHPDALAVAAELAAWQKSFEQAWQQAPGNFSWLKFHQQGLALTRRLQALLQGWAVIRYWRAPQDPQSMTRREIRV